MGLTEAGMKIAQTLADLDVVKQVAKVPAIKTTQNSYGYYAGAIHTLAEATGHEGKTGHVLAAEALRLAGGNGKGIDAAMSAMFGYSEYDALNKMLGMC